MDPVAAGEDGRMWEFLKSGNGSGHVARDGLWSLVIELWGGMIPLRLIERRNGRNYRRPAAARESLRARPLHRLCTFRVLPALSEDHYYRPAGF